MNFTRDPIIETIITPKDGFKLVIRSSKGGGHEEFIVDSVQVILIGNNCFYRSLEKPKPFVVPAHDYEVLEVRETRMVMKLPAAEKGGIKIGGGREPAVTMTRPAEEVVEKHMDGEAPQAQPQQGERRKEKKRFRRGRRDRFEKEEGGETSEGSTSESSSPEQPKEEKQNFMIPPPATLISETIARYKDIPGFASAFFEKGKEGEGEGEAQMESMESTYVEEMASVPVQEPVQEEEESNAPEFLFDDHS
jgi:hypothetical protein